MIPKVIHYCWFGGNPLPELAQKCLASWKKFCPDYEIMCWDETNFDVNCCDYVREAYEAKKWAFVSDYARLKALVDVGGVYMDTDVEVIRPIDAFLSEEAFSGFESIKMILTGIMACKKGFAPFAEMLADYHSRHFLKKDGGYDMTTNVEMITNYFSQHGFIPNNTKQTVKGFTIYPTDFFCPKDYLTRKIIITDNTHTIHHFAGSWSSPYRNFVGMVKRLIGVRLTEKVIRIKRFFRRILGIPQP